MGVDVLYQKLESANFGQSNVGNGLGVIQNTALQTGGTVVPQKDVDNVAIRFRVHRDFYP